MSDNTEEYERYTQIAKERPAKVEKQKVTSWQLVFQKSKTAYDKLASGGYALCQYCELPTHAKGDGLGFRSQHFD